MILQYVKEQKRYTKDELNKLFKSDNYDNTDEIKDILKKLREYGILKTVKYNSTQKNLSDLIEEDLELSEGINDKYYYVFKYVGIIMVSKYIIICIPKYVTSSKENEYIKRCYKYIDEKSNMTTPDNYKSFHDYYMFHWILTFEFRDNPGAWKEMLFYPNVMPHYLQFCEYNKPFDFAKWDEIISISFAHKLSYKLKAEDGSLLSWIIAGMRE